MVVVDVEVAIAVLVLARDSGRDLGRRSWSSSSLWLILPVVRVVSALSVVARDIGILGVGYVRRRCCGCSCGHS